MSTKKRSFFQGIRTPSIDFDEVKDGIRAAPDFIDVNLATARSYAAGTAEILKISGNTLFIDQKASSGVAQLVFEEQYPARPCAITVFPGFVARVPFTQVTVLNDAQAGTVLRIVYGTDLDFVPAVGAGVVISSITGPLSVVDRITGNIRRVGSSLVAPVGVTVTNVISAASNPNGSNVRYIYMDATAGAGANITSYMIAAAAAMAGAGPAAQQMLMMQLFNGAPGTLVSQQANINRALPAGWGIWIVDVNAIAVSPRNVDISIEAL